MIKRVSQRDVIGKLLKDNNMPDTPTARAIYRKMLEPDEDDDTQVYRKPWVALTDEDLDYLCHLAYTGDEEFALTVQAMLKKKNT